MTRKNSNGDAVGYGKPPRHSRFRAGRSGNPKGRPKGVKNLAAALADTLHERVTVSENGRRKTITKLEGITKQLVNKAITGDSRAMNLLLGAIRVIEDRPDSTAAPNMGTSEEDKKVMQQLINRIKFSMKGKQNAKTDSR